MQMQDLLLPPQLTPFNNWFAYNSLYIINLVELYKARAKK